MKRVIAKWFDLLLYLIATRTLYLSPSKFIISSYIDSHTLKDNHTTWELGSVNT